MSKSRLCCLTDRSPLSCKFSYMSIFWLKDSAKIVQQQFCPPSLQHLSQSLGNEKRTGETLGWRRLSLCSVDTLTLPLTSFSFFSILENEMSCDILSLQLVLKFFGANNRRFWQIQWEENVFFFLPFKFSIRVSAPVLVSASWKDCHVQWALVLKLSHSNKRKVINQDPGKLIWESEMSLWTNFLSLYMIYLWGKAVRLFTFLLKLSW